MSRPELAPIPALQSHPGEQLAILTGALAGRLADLLDQLLAGEQEQGSARAFLRAMARDAEDPLARLRIGTETHPLGRLTRAFALSPVEVDLLLLAGLPDEHEGYAGVLRTLHPRGEPRASVGLAAQLLCAAPAERRLLRSVLVSGAAVRAGIVRLSDDGPLFERSLLLADSLWPALHGLDAWPSSLDWSRPAPARAGLSEWLAGPAATRARSALAGDEPRTILVTAELEEIAQERGAALVAAAGGEPVCVALPARAAPQLESLVSLHAVARGVVPVVRIAAWEGPGAPEAPTFAEHPGPVVVAGRASGMVVRGDRPVFEVPAGRLTPLARQELWRAAAPELANDAADLAARYTVEPGVAMAAAGDARAVARGERRPLRVEDVAQGVRTRAGLTLSSGVKLVRPTATWRQLVLPERRMAQLREALDRLVHQGLVLDRWGFLEGRPGARGVRMLFAGGSGTGKTFSAEVMAHALGLDLLVVDISRVVSKWIGETEKNLAEVFDVAERAQAVLLFDEADALFGKRTEVSDAHDRYANLETAFLLTRLERFEGLAILSTNLRQNLDPAFLRRLEFVLDFEEPGAAERLLLWQGHLPKGAPLADDVNLRELASHYPVVGGFIRNAAVAAGFLAAAEGTAITRSHIVRAVRREYEKTGRAFPGLPAGMHAL